MLYRFVRALMRLGLFGFFRRVEIQGEELIPASGPVLFVSNHTNAFVDPLLVLTRVRRRVTLTAKSTLAKNPMLFPVIKGLGVILLHRASDRAEGASPRGNAGALSECVTTLRRGGAVFIFPEGVSHSDPAMRTFKTGAARVASDFLEADSGDLRIVPVGLHFTKKDRWRSEAVALIGDPVSARDWVRDRSGADEGTPLDTRALTEAMRSWVEALTVNFSSEEERTLLSQAERLMAYRVEGPGSLDRPRLDARSRVDLVHRLQRGAHVLHARDPDRFDDLAARADSLDGRLAELGVEAGEVSLSMHAGRAALFIVRELEVLLVGAPLAFLGWIAHLAPLTLTRRLVGSMSVDEDHPASNAVFLSIPIFGVWWLMIGVVSAVALSSPGWGLFCVVALSFSGSLHLLYRDRAGGIVRRIRTFLLWFRRPALREGLAADIEDWHERIRAVESDLPDRVTRAEGPQ